MKKIKIGIPRALLYHRDGILWQKFFTLLGCNIILSPETNDEIVTLGKNNTIDECCLSYKIYIGHILYLKNKCDYILISRICDYGPKDKVCTRLNGTYDNIRYLIPKDKIIAYNITNTKLQYEIFGFLKMGLKITRNIPKIIFSYFIGKRKQKNIDIESYNEQKNKLQSNNKKILIISHFYNLKDKYISSYIKYYLQENNITIIYSNCLDKEISSSYSSYFSDTLYWKYSKEMIGALYYYRHQINGIIFISTYPCGIDALVNNLAIYKNHYLPILNLVIDENFSKINIETKLESFLDIIKGEYHG